MPSKMRIYQNCKADDWFLRNVDDPLILQYATDIPCRVIDYSLTRTDVDLYRKDGKVWFGDTMLFDIVHAEDRRRLQCVPMRWSAACMAYRMGVSVRGYPGGLLHRSLLWSTGWNIIDERERRALSTMILRRPILMRLPLPCRSFASNVILLAGGHDKGIPFDDLRLL